MKRIFALLALLLCIAFAAAASAQELTIDEQVDKIFAGTKTVGGAFLVAKDGEMVYERYYGVQQKTTGVPVTEKSYFRSCKNYAVAVCCA